jgi:hypothetical protein
MRGIRSIFPLVLAAMLALSVVGFFPPATAGAFFIASGGAAPSPLLVLAKKRKCVSVARQAGRDVLVNRCASCRMVSIQKKRPGKGFPVTRELTLAKRSTTTLSFRGSGSVRILSDSGCDEAPAAQSRGEKCVRFHRFPDGSPALFNQCPACRVVVIEREAESGRRTRTPYSVTNRAYVPLRTDGAKVARIISDRACK